MKNKRNEYSYVETKSSREILVTLLIGNNTDVKTSKEDAIWLENGSTFLSCKRDSFINKISKEMDENQLALSPIIASFTKALVLWYVCGDRYADNSFKQHLYSYTVML